MLLDLPENGVDMWEPRYNLVTVDNRGVIDSYSLDAITLVGKVATPEGCHGISGLAGVVICPQTPELLRLALCEEIRKWAASLIPVGVTACV